MNEKITRKFTPKCSFMFIPAQHRDEYCCDTENHNTNVATDPAANGWSSMWMSGIVLGILGVGLSGGAIFALYWAKRNKRIMKASYPGNYMLITILTHQFMSSN
uniref:Uncharacterized protein n=1 Tax=Lutzomyia longipalpis TaxID=7200 RepID=A0A1B0CVQ7_LUTLO